MPPLLNHTLLWQGTAAAVVVQVVPALPNYVSRSLNTYFKKYLKWFRVLEIRVVGYGCVQHHQTIYDKVSSFINQLLQVAAVKGNQTRSAHKTHPTILCQGSLNKLELLTCAWFPNPQGFLSWRELLHWQRKHLTPTRVTNVACKRAWVRNGDDSYFWK